MRIQPLALRLGGIAVLAISLNGLTPASAHTGAPVSGVIHGCVKAGTGHLRVISAAEQCKEQETALDWNVAGAGGGVSGIERVTASRTLPFVGGTDERPTVSLSVMCPAGKLATGGGHRLVNVDGDHRATHASNSYPLGSPPNGWQATVLPQITFGSGFESFGFPLTLEVSAICVNAAP